MRLCEEMSCHTGIMLRIYPSNEQKLLLFDTLDVISVRLKVLEESK